jgi:hypothetical protein
MDYDRKALFLQQFSPKLTIMRTINDSLLIEQPILWRYA